MWRDRKAEGQIPLGKYWLGHYTSKGKRKNRIFSNFGQCSILNYTTQQWKDQWNENMRFQLYSQRGIERHSPLFAGSSRFRVMMMFRCYRGAVIVDVFRDDARWCMTIKHHHYSKSWTTSEKRRTAFDSSLKIHLESYILISLIFKKFYFVV